MSKQTRSSKSKPVDDATFHGIFHVKCFDKDGVLRWEDDAPNKIVNSGLNYFLNVALGAGAQITAWYLGLIDNAGTPTIVPADTHAVHSWTEAVAYGSGTRVAWTPGTSISQSITNPSTSNFVINASKVIYGLFLSNDSTKGGVSGASTMFSEAAFSGGNQTVSNTDTLQVTYTCNSASS